MRQIEWDIADERTYEDGVDRGVLYPKNGDPGVPWNGLVSITEEVNGGALEEHFFEGVKFLDRVLNEDFKANLEAYDAPKEFKAASGRRQLAPGLYASHQARETFGLSYRTLIADGAEGAARGYTVHIVWNVSAQPSARKSGTLSDTPTVASRSWVLTAVPVDSGVMKPTAHFEIRSDEVEPTKLARIEAILYGEASSSDDLDGGNAAVSLGDVDGGNAAASGGNVDGGSSTNSTIVYPRLPTQAEVIAILS